MEYLRKCGQMTGPLFFFKRNIRNTSTTNFVQNVIDFLCFSYSFKKKKIAKIQTETNGVLGPNKSTEEKKEIDIDVWHFSYC